jgi:lysophospholipase L1-like esterase
MAEKSKETRNKKQGSKKPAWVANLLLVCFSLMLPLVFAEIGLRLVRHKTISFDDRSFRQSNWSFKPHTHSDSYVGVRVRINNLGMRGPDVSIQKPPGTFRILGVGDSVTFGYGVPEENTFLDVLQDKLNDDSSGKLHYQVLNAGIPATGLDYYTHRVEEVGAELKPDLILVCMALNDIDPQLGPEPVEPHPQATFGHRFNVFMLTHSYLYNAIYVPAKSLAYKMGILDLKDSDAFGFLAINPPSPLQEHARTMMKLYLDRLSRDANQLKVPLVVVLFPVEPQLSEQSREDYSRMMHSYFPPEVVTQNQPEGWVEAVGKEDGFPVIDVLPALRSVESEHPYLRNRSVSFDPVHPSIVGAKACGLAIAQFLEQGKLVGNPKVSQN